MAPQSRPIVNRAVRATAVAAAIAGAACSTGDKPAASNSDSTPAAGNAAARAATATGTPTKVATVEGLRTPESVRYDPADDVYFVSNIDGNPNVKDGNGFISRIKADGTIDSLRFIAGGRGGVTLNAPKGIILVGDTLWVTDIDEVRAFNKRTGAAVATVDLRPQHAVFLNDLALGGDGAIYITDTGIRFGSSANPAHPGPDRIFKITPDHKASVAAQGDSLGQPNGIMWDQAGGRFIIGGFGSKSILAWKPGDKMPTVIATGPGGYDGLDMLDGRMLISSWADSSISVVNGTGVTRLITGVSAPADFGVDTKRHQIAIPRFSDNRVEIWSVPAR